jgi:hypothetical protein
MNGQIWTPEDDAIVIAGVNAGLDNAQIGAMLRRSGKAVQDHRCALGKAGKLPPMRSDNWTDEQDATLIVGLLAGKKYEELAAGLGRTFNAVKNRRGTLVSQGKIRKQPPGHPKGEPGHGRGGAAKPKGVSTIIGGSIRMVISEWTEAPGGVRIRTLEAV